MKDQQNTFSRNEFCNVLKTDDVKSYSTFSAQKSHQIDSEISFCSRTGSKLGISPLMLAAMNGHVAAVKLLLDMGSDVNAQV